MKKKSKRREAIEGENKKFEPRSRAEAGAKRVRKSVKTSNWRCENRINIAKIELTLQKLS